MGKKMWVAAGAAVIFLLGAALLWGRAPGREVPSVLDGLDTDPAAVDAWENVIAYVPLDDRIDNLEDVIYLAEASGYQVVLPPVDTYRTRLDGQPLNENGTQYGDREALFTWVREMEEKGCDLYLLSLDQLFSGGLVNSRAVSAPADLVFDDGTVLGETGAFDEYILSLADDPENRVYLSDSVVRLASTVGYQGFDLTEYYALRLYGMEARPALEGEELTLENVFAAYPYGEDGVTPAQENMDPAYSANLTEEMIRDYLGVRMRKLRLTDHVISALKDAPYDNIHLLIGIDDSSNTANIQYNELNYIAKQAGRGTTLLTGLDSLARLLVAKIAQDQYGRQVKTSVRYVGGTQGVPSSEYDRYTLEETVDLHMDLLALRRVPEAEAEVQVVVMTPPEDPDRAQACCEELVGLLEENVEGRVPTIFIEASRGVYGEALEDMLLERVDFAGLLAFVGRYYQSNITGSAFAMGFSRYLYLTCREEKADVCDIAQVRQMAHSMALSFGYVQDTRPELNEYIQGLGCNYNNIVTDAARERKIQDKLEETFLPRCERPLKNLEGSRMIVSLSPLREKEIGTVGIRDPYFPWHRTFELSFTIDVGELKEVE